MLPSTGRKKTTWREGPLERFQCTELGEETRWSGGYCSDYWRQSVLETLHSKFDFILHITQFSLCQVLNSPARIFYCGKATVAI